MRKRFLAMRLRILFPVDPLNSQQADGSFQAEYQYLQMQGFACSLFNYETLLLNDFCPKPPIQANEHILYRGWMMNVNLYQKFAALVNAKGATLVTSTLHYGYSHYLPNWYESCKAFTAETYWFKDDDNLIPSIQKLDWQGYFVKYFVKSNNTEGGSIAYSITEVLEIIKLLKQFRVELEGGIVLRKLEYYLPNTEQRYFVWQGKVYSASNFIPELAWQIAAKHSAPFYTIDLIQHFDGSWRLVEIGDGQVSDRKQWAAETFCNIFIYHA